MRRIICFCALSATLALGLSAANASAGQIVYSHGDEEIWAMNENGSEPHPIVTLAQVPGMNEIYEPQVYANGGATVAFLGKTNAYRNSLTTACGLWCAGLYSDASGAISRISPATMSCELCETEITDPRWAANGQILDNQFTYSFGQLFGVWGATYGVHEYFLVPDTPGSGGTVRNVEHIAPSDALAGYGQLAAAVPDPADARKVAYIGVQCQTVGCTPNVPLWVSTEGGGKDEEIGADDWLMEVAWSPDGSRFADIEGGGERGIWTYGSAPLSSTNKAVWMLEDPIQTGQTNPEETTFRDPAWIGNSEVAFTASDNIWAIPIDCGSSGTPCQFPRDATQLTFDGTTSAPDTSASWTSSTQPLVAPSGTGAGGGSTGGGSPQGPKQTPGLVAGIASLGSASVSHDQVDVTLTCGGPATSQCSERAQLVVVETLRGSRILAMTARKRRTHKRTVVLATGAATLAGGQQTTLVLALNPAGKALLKRFGRLTVGLQVQQTEGAVARTVANHSVVIKISRHHR
jgi:hypothetical protein